MVVVSNPGGVKRRWDPAVKAVALELTANVRPQRASRELDISENTKNWMSREARKAHRERTGACGFGDAGSCGVVVGGPAESDLACSG